MFARYAYAPNELGYCGPPESKVLLAGAAAGRGDPVGGATHAFHVFVVYPWVGLLGSGGDVARSVQCRVRWGTVESVDGEHARVRCPWLGWDGRELALAEERVSTCRWARGEHTFVADLRPGDVVAMHWDWICDRLDPAGLAALTESTARQLSATNIWLANRWSPRWAAG